MHTAVGTTAPSALTLTSVSPANVEEGTGPVSLTIAGLGFTSTTVVRIGDIAERTSFVSGTQLAVTVPAAQTATGAILRIVADDTQTSSVSASALTFEVDNPLPSIALLSPSVLPLGAVPQLVTIDGNGFLPLTMIEVNGSARQPAFVSGTRISIPLAAGDLATAGVLSITAVNPAPAGGRSVAASLAVDNPAPGPLILSPSSMLAYGSSALTITISGTNFVPDSTVLVDGIPRASQYIGSTQLSFQLTVADQASTGTLSIAVVNHAPGGGSSTAAALTLSDVVYASTLSGVVSDSVLTPGAQITGIDEAGRLQDVLNRGGIHLIVDGGYTLFAPLILYSNDSVEIQPGAGLVMGPNSNSEMFLNAHQNAPTTPSGTGGFLVSNQTDHDISLVNHGTLNFNSSGGAITGSDSYGGNNLVVAHKTDPASGKQINGIRFVGVDRLNVVAGEMYDSGTFTMAFSNDSNVDLGTGHIHHPLPIVAGKNTDGVHFFGPDAVVRIHDLEIASGDDAVALNADDIQEPQTFNFSGTAYPGVLHGPITGVAVEHVRLAGALSGLRLLSLTELIDGVSISDVTGTTLGPSFVATKFFASGGIGNFGTVALDGFNVISSDDPGTRPWDSIAAGLELDGKWNSFSAQNLRYSGPAAAVPMFRFGSGAMRSLTLNGVTVDTQAGSTIPVVFQIGGAVAQMTVSAIQATMKPGWTGSIFAGTQPPATLTVDGYDGPSALLASNWEEVTRGGDAFATDGDGIKYALRTSFDERLAGTPLIGTSPAVGLGRWAQASGDPPLFVAGGVEVPNVGMADATVVDCGLIDGTVSYTLAAFEDGWSELALRYTNRSDYVAVIVRSDHLELYDITGGVLTFIGATAWSPPLNSPISVLLNERNVSVSDGIHSPLDGVLPASSSNLTSTLNGFVHFGGGRSPMILSAMTMTPGP